MPCIRAWSAADVLRSFTPCHTMQYTPSPGISAFTTRPLLSLILAVFLSPEFGFLGFVMPTFRHTPFISGRLCRAGEAPRRAFLPRRMPFETWLKVALYDGVVEKGRMRWDGRWCWKVTRLWSIGALGREGRDVGARSSCRNALRAIGEGVGGILFFRCCGQISKCPRTKSSFKEDRA